ncbi:sulfatase [Flagellimonas myxillae]|uniref:sulfatase family protein n=1 Tax=Flagellimonas myxillae TaxID=2942214 RepID=UPI00201F1838|nr:sulfatase [Muricauda myxillae]MCL6265285.1 sulfatase [Muricauda myxillae]
MNPFARPKNYLLYVGLILLASCAPKTEQEEVEQPNILFILSDDHTSQSWGLYGGILQDYVKNENLNRLAQEGALLNNAFCTNSICTPSRGSILTGQYSHVNQVYTLSEPLPKGHPNIAKTLSEVGYQTAVIGKWHLVGKPEGFDYFNVLPGQGLYWNPIMKTDEDWVDGYDSSQGTIHEGFSTDVITDLTISHLEKRDTTKPFLMFCNFKATHEPFEYPERFAHLYQDEEIPEPESLMDFGKETTGRTFGGQILERLAARWEEATKNPDEFWTSYPGLPYPLDGLDSIQKRKKIYQKLVKDFMRCGAAIDDNIGKLLDWLEAEGIADNTIVVYTADQGYFLGEHGFFDKRLIYEESLRMPFVIRYPKKIKGGQRIDDIILNIDFAPLMADYAGIEKPDYMQGESFREILEGKPKKGWRKQMYYRYWLHHPHRPAHFGIRNDRYKLALFYGQPLGRFGTSPNTTEPQWEFYDLEEDPKELRNAIADEKYASTIAEMKKELLKEREKYGDMDMDYPVMQDILSSEFE